PGSAPPASARPPPPRGTGTSSTPAGRHPRTARARARGRGRASPVRRPCGPTYAARARRANSGCGLRRAVRGHTAAAELGRQGLEVEARVLDVADAASAEAFVRGVESDPGGVDVPADSSATAASRGERVGRRGRLIAAGCWRAATSYVYLSSVPQTPFQAALF